MNRRDPRTMTNARRANRAYGRRMAPGAPGADRIASRERLARRQRAERIARMRRRAQEEEEELEETTEDEDTEEREARMRSARRRRAMIERHRSAGSRYSDRRAGASERGRRVSKIDVLTARLDRIATLLEKQAEADPLAKGTQDLDRELDDELRPEELEVGEINEQPVTEDEALAEEVDGETTINTKPVSSRVRPIRMAHRSAGTDMDLF